MCCCIIYCYHSINNCMRSVWCIYKTIFGFIYISYSKIYLKLVRLVENKYVLKRLKIENHSVYDAVV
ncbi:hypothetical protein EB796_006157 [Bugula neritina]|uniref:Uncharacterized protein n=1 Tax=Bugula neritina TaxID=10212 RepID=A0A7J7KA62_BUGNE|nr:hypothetical protein EB796_006157 [Bugula neritina]